MKTKTIQFEKKEGLNPDVWERIKGEIEFLPDGMYECVIRKPVRSLPQNSSLHKYCELRAEQLEGAGIKKIDLLTKMKAEMPWSMEGVKEDIWKVFQSFKGFGNKTSKLKTNEVTQVFDLCTQFFGDIMGLPFIDFPNKEELQKEKTYGKRQIKT